MDPKGNFSITSGFVFINDIDKVMHLKACLTFQKEFYCNSHTKARVKKNEKMSIDTFTISPPPWCHVLFEWPQMVHRRILFGPFASKSKT